MELHEVVGQYELKECQLWGERPQEDFVPFHCHGVIPSDLAVASSDSVQNPVIVSTMDAAENIRRGEVAIPLPPAE